MAVRCWPEMFTDYGCAACGPMGLMNEARVPVRARPTCTARLTALALQEIAGEPSFLADIVDMDAATDTSVPGIAALRRYRWRTAPRPGGADPLQPPDAAPPGVRPQARPGHGCPVQAKNETKLVVAAGEMISAPSAPAPPA